MHSIPRPHQELPVELLVEPWPFEAIPIPGCHVCTALHTQLAQAATDRDRNDLTAELRNHQEH
ncbi:hypothetical protein ABT160_02160 [Streptomyces sp. NPDC001941]|uniref:hypothetical protein n=1 Tax=Streptomyces sp. NPDC001941 TaxID=3154659 RepID=UPI0033202720